MDNSIGNLPHENFDNPAEKGEFPIPTFEMENEFPIPTFDMENENFPKFKAVGFRCLECHTNFVEKRKLNAHLKTVHEEIYQNKNFPKFEAIGFQCLECNASFVKKSNLNAHLKTVHEKKKPFFCDQCASSFGKIDQDALKS